MARQSEGLVRLLLLLPLLLWLAEGGASEIITVITLLLIARQRGASEIITVITIITIARQSEGLVRLLLLLPLLLSD